MARRMMTLSEIRDGAPPFSSKAWMARKEAIANRILLKKMAPRLQENQSIERVLETAAPYRPQKARRTWWQRFIDWIYG